MERIADFVLKHKRLVILFWIVAMLSGFATTGKTVDRLTTDFTVPGQPGFNTVKAINKALGETDNGPSIPVVTVPAGQTVQQHQAEIKTFWDTVRKDHPTWRIADWTSTGDTHFITKDQRSTFALVYGPQPKTFSDKPFAIQITNQYAASAAAQASPLTVHPTGYLELAISDAESSGKDNSGNGQIIIEVLLGAGGALIILAFVFASFLALLPILIAAVSILTTFTVLLPLTYAMDMSIVLEFLLAFIGLGVAIDYSLLVVTRWREERQHGRSNDDAVRVAVAQAGHSVVFSGAAVAIGLLSLTVLNVPFLRSMGIGGMLIPLISTLVTITLTPAILASIGPKVDWPRIRKTSTSRFWERWTGGVVKRPWAALAASVVMLGLLAAPVFGIKLGNATTASLTSKKGPIVTQYADLINPQTGGVPRGVLTPLEVLTTGDPTLVTAALAKDPDVAFSVAPSGEFAKGSSKVVEVIPTLETVNSDTKSIVTGVRKIVEPLPGVTGVAGMGAVLDDYNNGIYKKVPLVVLVLSILTFFALTRAFRSVVLAIKAVLLNLISLAATFGVMTWVWQDGHGSKQVFDIQSTGSIIFWTPIMIFAFLYGLSMDYEVFILTRVREEYDRGGDTNKALVEGIGRTGRLVTSAALILFLAFVSLAASPGTDIKVLATGLGVGILLDATIVRMLLVPALVVLFADWNWYLPEGLAKLLRVKASHAHPLEPAAATA